MRHGVAIWSLVISSFRATIRPTTQGSLQSRAAETTQTIGPATAAQATATSMAAHNPGLYRPLVSKGWVCLFL